MNRSRLLAPGLAALLAGCNLAPRYHVPTTVPVPSQFKEVPGWSAAVPSDAVAKGDWWLLFADPELDRLERLVEVNNQNVAQYRAAYAAARAVVQENRAALFPTVTGQVNASRSGNLGTGTAIGNGATPGSTTGNVPTTTSGGGSNSRFTAQIGASWEPDLWGRLGNAVSQSRASAQASEGDLLNATLAARAELATDYLQLRGIDAQKDLLDLTVSDYTRALQIARNKYNAGTVARSDVYQAETSLANAQGSRRDLDRQRANLEHAIAVLTGQNPSSFALARAGWNPVVPQVPSTLPSAVIERRPDVAAAERRVAAANANIGIQRAAFFPRIGLSANGGVQSSSLADLFSAPLTFWSLGLSGVQTLLDFGANAARLAQSRAQYDQAAAVYRQTVLTAFQQVEDNLGATAVYADVATRYGEAAAAADQALRIARNQYLSGLVDYTAVITAQNAALSARQARITATVNRQTAAVALVQAIGGSWTDAPLR